MVAVSSRTPFLLVGTLLLLHPISAELTDEASTVVEVPEVVAQRDNHGASQSVMDMDSSLDQTIFGRTRVQEKGDNSIKDLKLLRNLQAFSGSGAAEPVAYPSPTGSSTRLSPTVSTSADVSSPVRSPYMEPPFVSTSRVTSTPSLPHWSYPAKDWSQTAPTSASGNTFSESTMNAAKTPVSSPTWVSPTGARPSRPEGGGASPNATPNASRTSPTASPPVHAPHTAGFNSSPPVRDHGIHFGRANKIYAKCGIWPKERARRIVSALSRTTTARSVLEDSSTPQHEALTWLTDLDGAYVCANDERLQQRYVLALMYFALNGREWSNCQASLEDDSDIGNCLGEEATLRWLATGNECLWYGVACDSSGRVIKLKLKDNGLAGTLPSELFQSLPYLTGLSLDHNKNIAGSIPLTIGAANLTYIELDDNALTGSFPNAFYQMKTLKAIDLNNNRLTGTISNDLGNLTDLMVLQLENNRFKGSLPADGLAQLSDLVLVTLHGNQFTGSLETVCRNVPMFRQTSPGYLQFFSTDCADTVECSCCSACF